MIKRILILGGLLVFCGCEKPVEEGYIIATVGKEKLTIEELMEEVPPQIRANLTPIQIREYVLAWINAQVLYQEALARKLDTRKDFQKEFVKLKRELLINNLVEQALVENVAVLDEDVKTYYEANKEGFRLAEDVVHAYHILLDDRKKASQVSQKLKAGETFEVVFREFSNDSTNGENWDLGYFSKDEIAPEISSVVFKLRQGATSLPIKSDFGYHVIQVVAKQKKGEVKNFELVQHEIRLKLEAKKKQDKYQRFLLQMKSKHPYQTNFQMLDSSVLDSLIEKEL